LTVVDASVLTVFYVSDDSRRSVVAQRLASGDALFAPAHIDAEVVSALRGLARSSKVVDRSVRRALTHLAGFPLRRMPLAPLLERMWQLRANVTAYDAAYIALAERLDCAFITCDAKLASATGPRCAIDLII
jgi:predicted nucleic acid-binding protein